jgi:hypothetical protein
VERLMSQTNILFPMIALAAWTFLVLLLVPYRRVKAAMNKQVVANDFKFGESANVPSYVSVPNRNLINLLEMPVLFYVVCLTLYVTGHADSAAVLLAWVYVAFRLAHSLIHLTYNNVFHRLAFYGLSNLVLLAMWIRLFLALLPARAS